MPAPAAAAAAAAVDDDDGNDVDGDGDAAPGVGASMLRVLSMRWCRSGDLLGRSTRSVSSKPSCSIWRAVQRGE